MSNVLDSNKSEELGLFLKRLSTAKEKGWTGKGPKKVYAIINSDGRHEYTVGQIEEYKNLIRRAKSLRTEVEGALEKVEELEEKLIGNHP